jgi:hypothetical protein
MSEKFIYIYIQKRNNDEQRVHLSIYLNISESLLGFLLLCLVFTYLFGENVGESERELMAIAVREELNAKLNRTIEIEMEANRA